MINYCIKGIDFEDLYDRIKIFHINTGHNVTKQINYVSRPAIDILLVVYQTWNSKKINES